MKPFDDADLNWITVVDEAGEDTLMSPATRRAVASRAAVAAVLETLGGSLNESARHHDALGWISFAELRGLAAEVKTGEDG